MDEKPSKSIGPVLVISGIVLISLIIGCVIGFKINADQILEAAIADEIASENPASYEHVSYRVTDEGFTGLSKRIIPMPSGRIENKFGQVITRFGKPGIIDAPAKFPEKSGVSWNSGHRELYAPGLEEATFYPDFLSSFEDIGFHCKEEQLYKYSTIYISSDWTSIARATVNVKDCYAKIEGWNFRCRLRLSQSSSYSNSSVDLDLYADREINMARKSEDTVVLTSPGTLAVRQGSNKSIDPVRDRVKNITIKENPNGEKPTIVFNEPE